MLHLTKAIAITSLLSVFAWASPPSNINALIITSSNSDNSETCGAVEFLSPYGLDNFNDHYIKALSTFLCAEQMYFEGDYEGADTALDALWAEYPLSDNRWNTLSGQGKKYGINLGNPVGYYGLRMLTDMTNWRLANPIPAGDPKTIQFTVIIPEKSSGIEPRNEQELENGEGIHVTHTIDPRLIKDNYTAIHESTQLFSEYVYTIVSQGRLKVETKILPLPNVDVEVSAHKDKNGESQPGGHYYAKTTPAGERAVWEAIPEEIRRVTDWWWLLYPSHVPEQYEDFKNRAAITGGMGLGKWGSGIRSASPLFVADDRSLVRKPPHIGAGQYSSIERAVYLPQWLQHEFYHHLYKTYPEFLLEEKSHQWFDRTTWPNDFEGSREPDYYHESLYKRLHTAVPGLHATMRYSTAGISFDELTIEDILGEYQREPVENAWHTGRLWLDGVQLKWSNDAGSDCNLTDDLANGRLLTNPGCPYYDNNNGGKTEYFFFVPERDENGDLKNNFSQFRGFGRDLFTRKR